MTIFMKVIIPLTLPKSTKSKCHYGVSKDRSFKPYRVKLLISRRRAEPAVNGMSAMSRSGAPLLGHMETEFLE